MEKLLFFDIETHRVREWNELTPVLQKAFESHLYNEDEYETIEECFREKSGLNAEFSQVICVSLGYEWDQGFKLSSIVGIDEVELLTKLSQVFDGFYSRKDRYSLAGHNINGFDIPYLIKRYIINNMKVPEILKDYENKPWERSSVDTMQIWKFGGWNNTSLEVISAVLGIECKSTEISGEGLYRYNIKDIDWEELKMYCEEDVKSSYEIYKRVNKYL